MSPDGDWWWDGAGWRRAISPDGQWRWYGGGWTPTVRATPPPGPRVGTLVAIIAGGAVVILIVVSVLACVAFKGLNGLLVVANPNSSVPGAIPCDLLEQTQVHYHAAVQILNQG